MSSYRRLLSGAAKRILLLIIGVLAVAPLPALSAAPQPAGSTLALAGRAFSVSFPIAPTAKNYLGPRGTLRAWFAETKAGLFIATDMPRSGTPKTAVERLVASFDGKLVSVKAAAIPGAPGAIPPGAIRYVFSLGGGENGVGLLVPAGDHVYGALALTVAKDDAAAARFVGSLVVPAAAKTVAEPPPGKVRTKALSAKAFDAGEHLAAALLVDPVDPAVLALEGIGESAVRAGARAGAPRPPVQIALADDPPPGIPDRKPDSGTSTQSQDAFGAAIASIPALPESPSPESPSPESKVGSTTPDAKVGANATPDALALPSLAAGSLARIASRTDVRASPVAAGSDQDGIPDPHADVGSQVDDDGASTQPGDAGRAITPVPDARPGSDAMLDDAGPGLDDVAPAPPAPPSPPASAAPPTDLQPPRNLLQPPQDLALPPDADQPPAMTASVPPPPPLAPAPYAPPPAMASVPPPPPLARQLPPGPAPYAPPPPALASQLPPAAAPAPARWIWLPDAWRWNGYRWQLLRGRWARAAD